MERSNADCTPCFSTRCLGQSAVDPGDIADAKGDRVAIEELVLKTQFLGILARPDQAVDPAFHRSFDAGSIQHILIDIGHGDRRPARGHAKGDVAGAAGDTPRIASPGLRHAPDEAILPQTVHPARHGIVHDVIPAGDIEKTAPTRWVFSSGLTSS